MKIILIESEKAFRLILHYFGSWRPLSTEIKLISNLDPIYNIHLLNDCETYNLCPLGVWNSFAS